METSCHGWKIVAWDVKHQLKQNITDLQIRVCNWKLIVLFLNQNIWVLKRTVSMHLKHMFNPYKPSILFVGYRQTVQTQIRQRL